MKTTSNAGPGGPYRVAALGDSITFGWPDGHSWTHRVEAALPAVRVHNAGINGDTLEGMMYRMERDVIDAKPDLCLLMGGSNDVFTGFGVDELQTIANDMAIRLAEENIPVAFGLPLPILVSNLEQPLGEFREWLRGWAKYTIPFYDAFVTPEGPRAELLPDGVHPTAEGYDLMADVAEKFLRSFFSID